MSKSFNPSITKQINATKIIPLKNPSASPQRRSKLPIIAKLLTNKENFFAKSFNTLFIMKDNTINTSTLQTNSTTVFKSIVSLIWRIFFININRILLLLTKPLIKALFWTSVDCKVSTLSVSKIKDVAFGNNKYVKYRDKNIMTIDNKELTIPFLKPKAEHKHKIEIIAISIHTIKIIAFITIIIQAQFKIFIFSIQKRTCQNMRFKAFLTFFTSTYSFHFQALTPHFLVLSTIFT